VLRDGWLGQRQGFDEVAHRALAPDQDVENAAATLLGQHLERNGHRYLISSLEHITVKGY
jgi:hypothetical protein